MNNPKHREPLILRVAIPTPLRRLFDYLPPSKSDIEPKPGVRVRVSFGRRQAIGIIVELASESDVPPAKLKAVMEILDNESIFPDPLFNALLWSADYYHHPVGDVFATALPSLLRQGEKLLTSTTVLSPATDEISASNILSRAPRQAALFELIKNSETIELSKIKEQGFDSSLVNQLEIKGLITRHELIRDNQVTPDFASARKSKFQLNQAQQHALSTLKKEDGFSCLLLDGVTGSGKTEVYIRAMEQSLANGKQCLLLVPEIGLTPQAVARFRERFNCPIVLLHSGLTNHERLNAWRKAREGEAGIVIGTRSAVFTPIARPGLIVIDEEHDSSLKQQDGFRYSARDFAIKRAQQEKIKIILGSATPSLESLNNSIESRYQHAMLDERAGQAETASMQIIDIEKEILDHGFSESLLIKIEKHLESGNQVLVFINRRGYAPVLQCQNCAWVAECENCIAQYTVHSKPAGLRCHHCGAAQSVPRQCPLCHSSHLETMGLGTQKLESFLERRFTNIPVMRIDRDSMRSKSSFDGMLERVSTGNPCILVGTQMLAKGHHFTDVTLVAVLDADLGLFSADFRGQEQMAQTIVQVAGRSGRGAKTGEVVIQSRHSSHPSLQNLISLSYREFAERLLSERLQSQMPPFSYLALLQVDSPEASNARKFAENIVRRAQSIKTEHSNIFAGIQILGPMPAPMEKRAGRFRFHLSLKSHARKELQNYLRSLCFAIEKIKPLRQTRWSLDVDPVDLI